MRKILVYLTVILLFTMQSHGQQKNDNIKFHSVDLGLGLFFNNNFGGLALHSSIACKQQNNLYSITAITGGEFVILGGRSASYQELNLQYGKQLQLAKWFVLEGFVGVGYYNQNSTKANISDGSSISLPFKINTKFKFNKHFGMGFMNNYSISKLNNNFTANILFHYNFN